MWVGLKTSEFFESQPWVLDGWKTKCLPNI